MAVRSSPPTSRPDHTKLQVGSEGQSVLQSAQKTVTRQGAAAAEADFDIDTYDLDPSNGDGDFVLHTEKSEQISDTYPNTGGAETLVLFIESSDDQQFSISIEWRANDDTVIGTLDQNIDSDLLSTSPSSGNHYIYVTVAIASDKWDVNITSEVADGTQNQISGSINIH